MKTLFLIMGLTSCVCFFSKAQYVTIPDTAFVNWMNANGLAGCLNGNQLDTTCPALLAVHNIYTGFGNIEDLTGITYFDSLGSLTYVEGKINYVPELPGNLVGLNLSGNQIQSLPFLPNGITHLYLSANQIASLPNLPDSLIYLECYNNPIMTLPPIPANVYHLNVSGCSLTNLPSLPTSLKELDCRFNQLTTLPSLPPLLTELYCGYNQLGVLPTLPSSLLILSCDSNNLTVVPSLPAGLNNLSFSYNHVQTLPALPPALNSLACGNNPIDTVPLLPNTINSLELNNLGLTSLPSQRDTFIGLSLADNPDLHCLNHVKRVDFYDFTGTGIQCLPNFIQVQGFGDPPLENYPICDLQNPFGCQCYWNHKGQVYLDYNSNCIKDGNDFNLQNVKVAKLQNGNVLEQISTNGSGLYSFASNIGSFDITIDSSFLPFSLHCPTSGFFNSVISLQDSMHDNLDFVFQCAPQFDLQAGYMSGGFVPGDSHGFYVGAGDATNYFGANCATGVSGTVTLVISGPVSYVAPNPVALIPSSIIGDTIVWNIADFGVVNFFEDFNLILQTDTTALLGTPVCFSLFLTPINGDRDTANNRLSWCDSVRSSYDPNDKSVYPSGNIDTSQQWLTYTIRFQNTGTADAQNIHIDDTLDVAHLDVGSFQLMGYSHQPIVQVLEGGIARFNFPGINLPDSNANEPASHGFVQYKIKVKPGQSIGTQIKNTAYIYFDFNAPVVTNTVVNQIAIDNSIGIKDVRTNTDFDLFPNPAVGTVTARFTEGNSTKTYQLLDITGRIVLTGGIYGEAISVNVSGFPRGVYYFKTLTVSGNPVTKKLVLQ